MGNPLAGESGWNNGSGVFCYLDKLGTYQKIVIATTFVIKKKVFFLRHQSLEQKNCSVSAFEV